MTEPNQEDAKNARIDWLLKERVGGETPPDLQHAVLSQLQTESETANPATQSSRWLAAALVVIGIGAVIAVSQISGARPSDQTGAHQDGEPKFIVWHTPTIVRTRQDIEALPKDTKQVFGINLSDDALPALLRLQKLEAIAMTVSTFEALRGGPLKPKTAPIFVTDDGIERLAALPKLQALILEGQLRIQGPGLVRLVKNTTLRELNLVSMAIPDKLLADLCELPLLALRLNGSQSFGDAGIKAIASSATLREVSLRGCTHLEDHWIANLSGMASLEALNLGGIGSHTIFTGIRLNPLPEPAPGSGVTDRLMQQLAPLPKLRRLSLSAGSVTDKGVQALQKIPSLRELDLGGVGEITAAGIDALPAGISSLHLIGHQQLDASMMQALLARTSLRDLHLGWCKGMDQDAIDNLCAATHLKSLNVAGWELSDADRKRLSALTTEVNLGKSKR